MRIEWVNHASFIVESGAVRLICDPWLEGRVFDESWCHVSPTSFTYDDFAKITHIWFSHEHPDHFFPPNLKRIPAKFRERITVLFQATDDHRVANFCRELKFGTVRELPAEWTAISSDMSLYCQAAGRGDSWLAIRSGGKCLLNLNDCIYMSEADLLPVQQIVGKTDVLVTQFSYASWWGNAEDAASWRAAAKECLDKVEREINVLRPKYVIPAASFVFFCHEENRYMNEHINQVAQAWDAIREMDCSTPVVLYPGDVWILGEPSRSESALARYAADYQAQLADPVRVRSQKVSLDGLQRAATTMMGLLAKRNSAILLRRVPAATIWLADHEISVRLDRQGMHPIPAQEYDSHDVALNSAALNYCLRFQWGGETLMINGRFAAPRNGDRYRFFRWCSIAQANSRATYYDRSYYFKKAVEKVSHTLSR